MTRFRKDGINFTVKDPIPGKADHYWVLHTSMATGGYWPRTRRRGDMRQLQMSANEIRQRCAEDAAERAVKEMTTSGMQLDAMGHSKLVVVRNGKPQLKANLRKIHEAFLRVKQKNSDISDVSGVPA